MKTMKNITYIIILLLAISFTTTSCEGFLDITPEGQVKRDPLLSTPEGIEDALYGVYSQMRSTSLYGQEMHFSTLEILAQTLYCDGNDGVTAMGKYDWKHSSVISVFESVWTAMYKNISNVNSILDAPLVAEANEYPYTIYRGEALGLRAFMHFDLVRLFAEQYTVNPKADGIPYATEFSLKTPEFESLEDNYKHILKDLLEAEELLADEAEYENSCNFMLDRQIHFNLYAVQATLARVYLTMGNEEHAAIYAEKVINGGKYILKEKTEVENDLAGVLSKKECIFGIYHPGFYTQVNAKLQQTTTRYSLNLRADYASIYDKENSGLDFRTTAYFTTATLGDEKIDRLSKLTDIYELNNMVANRPADLITGINMIRLPEMYYIIAESLIETDNALALEYYNAVRTHRGLEPLEEGRALDIDLLNEERYKEFIGEGQTYFNMKRLNQPISSYDNTTVYQPGSNIYVAPIPDSEYENRF